MNDFFDEAMVMLGMGFRNMQYEGSSKEDIIETCMNIRSALLRFTTEILEVELPETINKSEVEI